MFEVQFVTEKHMEVILNSLDLMNGLLIAQTAALGIIIAIIVFGRK